MLKIKCQLSWRKFSFFLLFPFIEVTTPHSDVINDVIIHSYIVILNHKNGCHICPFTAIDNLRINVQPIFWWLNLAYFLQFFNCRSFLLYQASINETIKYISKNVKLQNCMHLIIAFVLRSGILRTQLTKLYFVIKVVEWVLPEIGLECKITKHSSHSRQINSFRCWWMWHCCVCAS